MIESQYTTDDFLERYTLREHLHKHYTLCERYKNLCEKYESKVARRGGLKGTLYDGVRVTSTKRVDTLETDAIEQADLYNACMDAYADILHSETFLHWQIRRVAPDNAFLRLILKHRFIDCMEWVDVSRAIYGDPYRVESVKKIYQRFIKKYEAREEAEKKRAAAALSYTGGYADPD